MKLIYVLFVLVSSDVDAREMNCLRDPVPIDASKDKSDVNLDKSITSWSMSQHPGTAEGLWTVLGQQFIKGCDHSLETNV